MLESFKIKVLLKKADSLFNQEKYDDSLIYYEKILSLNNNHIKSLYRKAYIFYIWKYYEKSINTLKLIHNLTDFEDALLLLGRINLINGNYDDGIHYYNLSLNENIFNLSGYIEEILFFSGDWKFKYTSANYNEYSQYSLDLCDLCINKYDDKGTKIWKSYKLYSLGHFKESLKCIDEVLSTGYSDSNCFFIKSENLLNLKKYEDALIFCEKGLHMDSNDNLLNITKGKILYFLKNYEESFKYLSNFNNNSESEIFLSKLESKRKNFNSALEHINKAIFLEQENFLKLKEEFHIINYGNDYYDLFWHKSLILYNLDKFEESNKIIDCLIEKEESAKNYCLKAKILYEMGDYENALMFVNKALDLKPDCREAIQLKENLINSS